MFHRAQQRGVDEGRAHHVDADAVVALGGCILEKDAQGRPPATPHISEGWTSYRHRSGEASHPVFCGGVDGLMRRVKES